MDLKCHVGLRFGDRSKAFPECWQVYNLGPHNQVFVGTSPSYVIAGKLLNFPEHRFLIWDWQWHLPAGVLGGLIQTKHLVCTVPGPWEGTVPHWEPVHRSTGAWCPGAGGLCGRERGPRREEPLRQKKRRGWKRLHWVL